MDTESFVASNLATGRSNGLNLTADHTRLVECQSHESLGPGHCSLFGYKVKCKNRIGYGKKKRSNFATRVGPFKLVLQLASG